MVRSSIPQQQTQVFKGPYSGTMQSTMGDISPHDEQGNPIWKPMNPFPVDNPVPGAIIAGGDSRDKNLPPSGRTINLDLGDGSIITGIIQGYYTFPDGVEYVQITSGQNIFRRPVGNIRER